MSTSSSAKHSGPGQHAVLTKAGNRRERRVVGYAWVSVAADVDFEGEDVRDSLAAVMRMAEAGWLRPPGVSGEGEGEDGDEDENTGSPVSSNADEGEEHLTSDNEDEDSDEDIED